MQDSAALAVGARDENVGIWTQKDVESKRRMRSQGMCDKGQDSEAQIQTRLDQMALSAERVGGIAVVSAPRRSQAHPRGVSLSAGGHAAGQRLCPLAGRGTGLAVCVPQGEGVLPPESFRAGGSLLYRCGGRRNHRDCEHAGDNRVRGLPVNARSHWRS